ncbi:DUF6053 domain-containing protein [Lysobacter enzymogenes]|uniref:DUF6053 domain-containing protein n=1 Tax=Lysobacter enzymogenes TaxID=69 RepID=UPI003D18D16B
MQGRAFRPHCGKASGPDAFRSGRIAIWNESVGPEGPPATAAIRTRLAPAPPACARSPRPGTRRPCCRWSRTRS